MAELALNAPALLAAASGLFSQAAAVAARLRGVIADARRAEREIGRLERITDAELAMAGLTREAALRQVFARNFA